MRLGSFEWNCTSEHLEQNISEGPCVDCKGLLLPVDDFRRLVVNGSYESVSPSLISDWWKLISILVFFLFLRFIQLLVDFPGVTEVDDFAIEVCVEHDILRLHVSMHDALFLNKLDEIDQLGEHDAHDRFADLSPAFLDQLVQTSTFCDFENKV